MDKRVSFCVSLVSSHASLLFFSQISRCLKPGGRFVSVTFVSPLLRKRLYARAEYDWSIRKYSYGEGFEYFVYVMTKGEALSPEDAALQKKQLQINVASTQSEQHMTAEEFLGNIDLWLIWIALVRDSLLDFKLSFIPQTSGTSSNTTKLPYFCLIALWFLEESAAIYFNMWSGCCCFLTVIFTKNFFCSYVRLNRKQVK